MANVLCYGCFDLLHTGHMCFLKEAASKGNLYVGVLPDDYVTNLKGSGRPVMKEQERLDVVKSLNYVKNAFILQKTMTPLNLLSGKELSGTQMIFDYLKSYKIDILFLPAAYQISNPFREIMKNMGIEIKVAKKYIQDVSTTKIIEQMNPIIQVKPRSADEETKAKITKLNNKAKATAAATKAKIKAKADAKSAPKNAAKKTDEVDDAQYHPFRKTFY